MESIIVNSHSGNQFGRNRLKSWPHQDSLVPGKSNFPLQSVTQYSCYLKLRFRNVPPHTVSVQGKLSKPHLYWRSKQWHFHTSGKPHQINCLTEQKPISSIPNKASYYTCNVSVSKISSPICFHLCSAYMNALSVMKEMFIFMFLV